MRRFACASCGAELDIDALRCRSCSTEVAYDQGRRDLVLLWRQDPAERPAPARGSTTSTRPAEADARPTLRCLVRCRHAETIGCNWLAEAPGGLCPSCTRTRTVPDLGVDGALEGWATFEAAKRRVLHQLATLPLDLDGLGGGPALVFDLLTSVPSGGEPVTIGHASGVVTLDVAEADLLTREQVRLALDEPYRTPLGHVRHEIGHFAWEARIERCPQLLAECRAVFGDDRADYAAALADYYDRDDDGTWQSSFITRYATAHPWEDVAETFAHLLHVADVLETAAAYTLIDHAAVRAAGFEVWYRHWSDLHDALGALNRAVGAEDPYPVVAAGRDGHALRRKLTWLWELFFAPDTVTPTGAHRRVG